MTKIKCCGLRREEDIAFANALRPEYIGFVFAPGSRRFVSPQRAMELKKKLYSGITSVGVFVDERPETVAELLNSGLIDMAQLHGKEDDSYIRELRKLTEKPLIKAWQIGGRQTEEELEELASCPADLILLDSGSGGTGETFDWELAKRIRRPYFLAGGLDPYNVKAAVELLHPYAVDVSSGIETDRCKDEFKMKEFIHAVRGVERKADTI